jgi:hypothetical protein
MDHVSAGEVTRDGARSRRHRMRDHARSQHGVTTTLPDRYQTPEWLERSFVLPLTQPEANNVPSQSVPHHDDDPVPTTPPVVTKPDDLSSPIQPAPPGQFVRPPSDEIDFARVVRRADLCRVVGRVAWAAAGLAGLALITYLLFSSMFVLAATIACAMVAATALVVRVRLTGAPVPRLQR